MDDEVTTLRGIGYVDPCAAVYLVITIVSYMILLLIQNIMVEWNNGSTIMVLEISNFLVSFAEKPL